MIGIDLLGKGTLPAAEAVGSGSRGLGMPWSGMWDIPVLFAAAARAAMFGPYFLRRKGVC